MKKNLKLLRVCHKLKSKELAYLLRISPSYLSELETGKKKISIQIIEKYAEVFETTPATIMFFLESGNKNKTLKNEMISKVLSFFDYIDEVKSQTRRKMIEFLKEEYK